MCSKFVEATKQEILERDIEKSARCNMHKCGVVHQPTSSNQGIADRPVVLSEVASTLLHALRLKQQNMMSSSVSAAYVLKALLGTVFTS